MQHRSCSNGAKRPNRNQSAGFTLPELLVCVFTLVLLAVMLLPAFASNRQSAMLQCKSNLKRVGWAIDMYTQDNGSYLPGRLWGAYSTYQKIGPAPGPDSTTYTTWSLAFCVATYLGHPAPSITNRIVPELVCPISNDLKPGFPTAPAPSPPLGVYVSYHLAAAVTNGPNWTQTYPFGRPGLVNSVQTKTIRRPSENWALVDADQANTPSGAIMYPYLPTSPVHSERPGQFAPISQRNTLFFDGSVRTVK
jgi:prepilin-type processing-associated H-X9-DG protein